MMSEVTRDSVDTAHRIADELFSVYPTEFGAARAAYHGHVHRGIDLVAHQMDLDEATGKLLGVAGFFHDAGIWLDNTFDYLGPSIRRALDHLHDVDAGGEDLVRLVIFEHHRLRRARSEHPLVEAFRRADLTDLTGGLVPSPGVSFREYRQIGGRYPSHGFRWRLTVIFLRWTLRHPLRPLPMMKW
ncbi:MAG: hypothetical protein GXP36_13840 [Actinobacteria bacterium]|nr:hypothetical protein [Actinomycetota bacterium]